MKEEWAGAVLQAGDPFQLQAHQFVHVAQPAGVGDLSVGLDAEAESPRCGLAPLLHLGDPGKAVERVIQLNRGEGAAVELEHLLGGQILRVEGAPPLRITESGGPDVETSGHQAAPVKVPRGRGTMRVALAVALANGRGGLGPRRAPSDGSRLRLAPARPVPGAG